jgi:hypothetical protein
MKSIASMVAHLRESRCQSNRHCEEPFDAACGVAQDKPPLRGSDAAIQ